MTRSADSRCGGSGEELSRPLALLFAVLAIAMISSFLLIALPSGAVSAQTPGDGDGNGIPDYQEEDGPGGGGAGAGDGGDDSEEEEAESAGACERGSNESFTDSFAQLSGATSNGKKTPASNTWMTCSPDYYYLTYVDTRSLFGKVSDLAEKPAVTVVSGLGKTIFNSFASSAFVWHAKLMALTLAVMNWAFDIDFVQTFEPFVERIVRVLGNRVYKPLLGGAWGIALAYAAWKGIARDQVSDAIVTIVKTAVIGSFGFIMIQSPLRVVNWYDSWIDDTSNFVFSLAADVAEDGAEADGKANCDPREPGCRPGEQDGRRFNVLSAAVWNMYVDEPWSRLQISNSDPSYAEKNYFQVLDIKNQDERAEKLCEMAGSSCGDVSGGEEPEEDTSGEDTSMEDDSSGEEEDDSDTGSGTPNPND